MCIPVTEESKTTGNIPSGTYALGDEYICEVKEDVNYHFFVLSAYEYNVNLIMDRNICSDGTIATSENKCTVAWISKIDYNDDDTYGYFGNGAKCPVTAMNYLNSLTSNWTNIDINYTDEGKNYGYKEITTNKNTTNIINKQGDITSSLINLKARLPMYSEILNAGCTTSNSSCPLWLANNLNGTSTYYEQGTNISNISGCWSSSSYGGSSYSSWGICFMIVSMMIYILLFVQLLIYQSLDFKNKKIILKL